MLELYAHAFGTTTGKQQRREERRSQQRKGKGKRRKIVQEDSSSDETKPPSKSKLSYWQTPPVSLTHAPPARLEVLFPNWANGEASETDSEESNAVRHDAWHTFVYISIRTHAHNATGGGRG